MNIVHNLSIRNKLFIGFFVISFVCIGFVVYLLIRIDSFTTSLGTLNNQAKKLQLLLKVDSDNKQLSDAVQSYILTGNSKWEKTYKMTSVDLSQILQQLGLIADKNEIAELIKFETISSKAQERDVLILEKKKEGDTKKAIKLFDEMYQNQQIQTTRTIADVIKKENSNFFKTLQKTIAAISSTKNVLFGMSLFIFFITVIIAYIMSLVIEIPIRKLAENVKKIAEGDLQARVPVTSKGEIGKLGNAFNNMGKKLQESYTELEQKVTENTKKLSEKVIDLEDTKKVMLNLMEDVQKEKNIAEQEKAKDEAIISSIGDGMVGVDPLGTVIIMNPVAEEILGITTQKAQGKSIFELYQLYDDGGNIVPREKRPIDITLKTGQKTNQTYSYRKPDASKITLNITVTPIKQKNSIIGTIEVLRDITKEKEIDRMKTEFISLASHQLRTPLSAIKWFSEMLEGGDAGELTIEQKDFTHNISESTERMIELVNSLLNISRIESGRILIDPKPTDLKELVENLVKELHIKIAERQQNLIVSVHQELPKINVDPRLIRQVYMNLLTNAIKYTPKKGDISVFISRKDNDIISQVTDNGYGIPKAQQEKIFQKFFRAENVAKIETDGTGLGLYLIKAIVESSHGKIWFESEEGKGTSFFFSVPMSGMEAKKGEVTLDE